MVLWKHLHILRTIPVLTAICLTTLPAQAKYSGGTGEPNDPYQIATAADLIALGETPADHDKHFLLTADIDLDPNLPGRKVFDKAVIAPDTNETQEGFQGTPFAGVFDGNDHTISHVTATGGSYLGLFGRLGLGAEVKDLGAVDVNVTASGSYVGGLVGHNNGTITQCNSEGTVSGQGSVGGVVGLNYGTVTHCYSTGTVAGGSCVGGLVGRNWHAQVTQCYSTGAVSGTGWEVGGLVGYNEYGDVTHCYSTGAVGGNNSAGGLAGANSHGTVTQCYSTGRVGGKGFVGGLVARNFDGEVAGCFWDTQTSGQTESPGGGTGKTTAEMQTAKTFLDAGWDFVGETANGKNDIWWIDQGHGYPRLRCEPAGKYGGGTGEPNDPYLIFTAEHMNAIGTEPNDWDKDFKLMADIDMAQCADRRLNLIGYQGPHVGSSPDKRGFSGVFDGNGHTISNVAHTSTGLDAVGLFRHLDDYQQRRRAIIKNLGLIDPNINATGDYVGALVGFLRDGLITGCYVHGGRVSGNARVGGLLGGTISAAIMGYLPRLEIRDCHATTAVSGTRWVGGLIGSFEGSLALIAPSVISRCYAMGDVSGTTEVGGLVGIVASGEVVNCYAQSRVSASRIAGGLLGSSGAIVNTCYAAGRVDAIEKVGGLIGSTATGFWWPPNEPQANSSYWDVEASGQTLSAGGAGKTTAEMRTAKTFLDAGWDFVGETTNGAEDIWWINEGKDYPRLSWEAHD